DRFRPRFLHSQLVQNPCFFAQVLSAIYRPKEERRDAAPDQTKRNLAEAAHGLLESWVGVPGVKSDGTIDADALNKWVTEARKICGASGRIEVCDIKIGEQLAYGPL